MAVGPTEPQPPGLDRSGHHCLDWSGHHATGPQPRGLCTTEPERCQKNEDIYDRYNVRIYAIKIQKEWYIPVVGGHSMSGDLLSIARCVLEDAFLQTGCCTSALLGKDARPWQVWINFSFRSILSLPILPTASILLKCLAHGSALIHVSGKPGFGGF